MGSEPFWRAMESHRAIGAPITAILYQMSSSVVVLQTLPNLHVLARISQSASSSLLIHQNHRPNPIYLWIAAQGSAWPSSSHLWCWDRHPTIFPHMTTSIKTIRPKHLSIRRCHLPPKSLDALRTRSDCLRERDWKRWAGLEAMVAVVLLEDRRNWTRNPA